MEASLNYPPINNSMPTVAFLIQMILVELEFVSWFMTTCRLVEIYCFGGTFMGNLLAQSPLLCPGDKGSIFIKNVKLP
jgi:hypothetical protein